MATAGHGRLRQSLLAALASSRRAQRCVAGAGCLRLCSRVLLALKTKCEKSRALRASLQDKEERCSGRGEHVQHLGKVGKVVQSPFSLFPLYQGSAFKSSHAQKGPTVSSERVAGPLAGTQHFTWLATAPSGASSPASSPSEREGAQGARQLLRVGQTLRLKQ